MKPDQSSTDTVNIDHLTRCDGDGCERCENLMYFYQACDGCGEWGHNDAGPCQCLRVKSAPAEVAQPVVTESFTTAEVAQGEAWADATARHPEIASGRDIEVLVAVKRKHNGKIYVFTTSYLNAYPVIYQDQLIQDDDNDQPEITGWYYLSEDEETWHRTLAEGDELLAWMYKPSYPQQTTPPPIEPALTNSQCACGDEYAANSYGAGFMAANNGVCENCDTYTAPPSPDAELVELLSWLRGSINCTPANDADKCGAWISTKHPMIQRIDAKLATFRT